MKKIFLAVVLTLVMICNVAFAMKISVLNVGQGDATLIQTSAQNILIDTSDYDERNRLKVELYKANAFRLDKIILTHPHADHIANCQFLIQNGVFKVKSVYDNGVISTSKYYQNYVNECIKRKVFRGTLTAGNVIDLGDGATLTILYPPREMVDAVNKKIVDSDPNNESLVGILRYGNFSMILTGDAEGIVEKDILPQIGHCTILKAGHHGSQTSSTRDFVNKVKPEYVLISAGTPTDKRGGNTYGHPHILPLQNFLSAGVDKNKILWTAVNGTITIDVSKDGSYTVKAENNVNWIDFYLLTHSDTNIKL